MKSVDPDASWIEALQSHTGITRATSMMVAPMSGHFPAILPGLSTGKCPNIARQRRFRRSLDTFRYSQRGGV